MSRADLGRGLAYFVCGAAGVLLVYGLGVFFWRQQLDRAARKDVLFVISEFERGAKEDWDYTEPILRHGPRAIGILAEEASPPGTQSHRLAALKLLGYVGSSDKRAHEALLRALEDQDVEIRTQAISALCWLGQQHGEDMRDCLPRLRDLEERSPLWRDPRLRWNYLHYAIECISGARKPDSSRVKPKPAPTATSPNK